MSSPEPVAIIGMGCRFPGDSDTPDEFWQMLAEERSGFSRPPLSRWNIDGFHANKARPGSITPEGGYFINEDIWKFDPAFFGIVQEEAKAMDPQQRKLLECVYESFESGGITLSQLSGSNTGCYIGNFTSDYYLQGHRDHNNPRPYSLLGSGYTIISNRVSYLFDLCGPSLTIDTACSSSLYSLHIACRALQTKEIDAAVVGGTNLMLAVETQMSTDKVGVLSATSTCHTFDESADGYGRAEGVGAIFLKRLSDAIRDNDPIRGVIRGTATNANGKTSGITQPSAKGHETVMRTAYEFAGLDPRDTSYFETHGTGTQVGDPIEIKGVGNVFVKGTDRQKLLVGSVKTNVGHSEAASALASIIKVCLAMEKRTIPATIGIKKLNPKIDFRGGRIEVVQKMTPWPKGFSTCRASINSFGYGGANAHAIVEAADSVLPGKLTYIRRGQDERDLEDSESNEMVGTKSASQARAVTRSEFLLLFSAHDISTLKSNIERCRDVAEDYNILDLAYTLGCRRSNFFNCAYTVAREEDVEEDLMEHEITFGKRGKGGNIGFIFTGQGAQNAQMGRELMLTFPSYIDTIRKLDRSLQSLGDDSPDWTIEDILMEPAVTSRINDVEISQPVCTAVQIALVGLLRLWNVTPVACIGHSSGEIASSYAANLITAEEAIISAFYRGRGVGTLKVKGAMLAVGAGPEEIQPFLTDGLRIACYNSPNSVTLSGDIEPATIVQKKLESDRVFVRELKTGGRAYHSHHMLNIGNDYESRLSEALSRFGASQTTNQAQGQNPVFFSSVTAQQMPSNFKPGPSYWRQNLESPVRFTEAVEAALAADLGISQFVEIGPHSALAGPLRQIRDNLGITPKNLDYASTLVRGQSSVTRLLDLAGTLTMRGFPVNIERVNAIEKREADAIITKTGLPIVDLPRFSWNYSAGEIRNKNRPSEEHRLRKFKYHDLLGAILPGSSVEQRQWRNMLDSKNFPWLEEHKLGTQPVLPGTGYLAIATEAARQFFHDKLTVNGAFRYFFPNISITSALNIPPSGSQVEIVTTMKFATITASITSKTIAEFTISSIQAGNWTNHCVGTVTKKKAVAMAPRFDESRLQEPKAARTWYRGFQKVSLNYGPAFNGLSNIRTNPALEEAVADTELCPEGVSEHDSAYIVHPAAMDTCIQVALIGAHKGSLAGLRRSFVPTSMSNVSLWSWGDDDHITQLTPGQGKVLAHAEFFSLRAMSGWCQLFSPEGKPLFEIEELSCTQYSEALDDLGTIDRHPYLRTVWKPDVDKMISNLTDTSLLDLVVHKRPGFNICEILNTESLVSDNIHKVLESGSSLRRYKTYTIMTLGDIDIEPIKIKYEAFPGVVVQKLVLDDVPEMFFDLVIVPEFSSDEIDLIKLKGLLTPDGNMLLYSSELKDSNTIKTDLQLAGLDTLLEDHESLLIGPHKGASSVLPAGEIVLVTRTSPTVFDSHIYSGLSKSGRSTTSISLQDFKSHAHHAKATYVFIVESESSLFHESLTSQELATIQSIASEATNMLWVTHGNLLEGGDPNAGIVIGLGRCLQTEHPTLTFKTLDLDHRDHIQTISNITTILDAADSGDEDKEFMVKNGIFYVSRLSQDPLLDQQFVAGVETEPRVIPYEPEKCVRLGIERVGIFDTIHFKDDEWEAPLKPGEVEVDVKAVGLNMKDFATLQGTYNSEILGLEGAGVVRSIGLGVKNVAIGDRVSWAGFGNFRNIERYDSRFLQKLQPEETFDRMSSIMMPFLTAIYGLIYLAKLQPGESVLINSATGGVGLAAIQIAKMIGAEIFATVGTPEKKKFLIKEYGLQDDHVLSSKDASFAAEIMQTTGGRGVDVSLNSLVREQLRATWNCIGHHGRHIELGQTDILDQGILDMSPFKRGASFIAMDLVLVFEHKPDLVSQILGEIMQYYRERRIQILPNLSVFPASAIGQAFEEFGKSSRIGRIVVSFDTEKINFAKKKKSISFKSNGSYLLVGCLGGLGRCLARHMVEKGARHLIFLGRSGEDRPEAASMIKDFRNDGITVDVVKGDVTRSSDVQKAVDFAAGQLFGVVQGVMALDDRLFTSHDLNSWEYAVRPKVTGTWNLHNAVASHRLDFFVMLGSSSALSGFPTQSNYCAGNSFLEFFARYRQSKGLPATTISLTVVTEVGFVSQNERIEDGLARTGVHTINEAGVIDLIDTAMMKAPSSSWNLDPLANNFIVTGVEPLQLSANLDIDSMPFWRQPRIGPVLNAVLAKKSGNEAGPGQNKRRLLLPDILEMITEKFSQTFNVAVEDIDPGTEVVRFGMDSMIGTSLRTWCYKTLGADIAASEFMSLNLTAESLAKKIYDIRSG